MSTQGSTGGGGDGSDQSTGTVQSSTGLDAGGAGGGSSAASTGFEGTTAGSSGTGSFKWGDGWRDALAGGDAKTLQRLGRFNSPEDMWRSYTALEARMSSGELKSALKPDATQEEITAWRKANGVPEKPGDYDLKFTDGLVIGEDDKPVIDQFLAVAHKNNLPTAAVRESLAWYYDSVQKQTEDRATKDTELARSAQDSLRNKWGQEYRPNINAVHALLDGAPAGFKDRFLNGRLADGTPIGSDVAGLEWMANMSRQLNPAATVVPAGTANAGQAITDELQKFKAMMGNDNSEYWKGPKAKQNQARYRELVSAQSAMATRGK